MTHKVGYFQRARAKKQASTTSFFIVVLISKETMRVAFTENYMLSVHFQHRTQAIKALLPNLEFSYHYARDTEWQNERSIYCDIMLSLMARTPFRRTWNSHLNLQIKRRDSRQFYLLVCDKRKQLLWFFSCIKMNSSVLKLISRRRLYGVQPATNFAAKQASTKGKQHWNSRRLQAVFHYMGTYVFHASSRVWLGQMWTPKFPSKK